MFSNRLNLNSRVESYKFLTICDSSFDLENLRTHFLGRIIFFNNIPIIGIYCSTSELETFLEGSDAFSIFDPITPEKGIDESIPGYDFDKAYLNILKWIDSVIDPKNQEYNKKLDLRVLNISLRPPIPYSYNILEPMNIATKAAANKGFIIVFAAGNEGKREGNNMLSPWAISEWVIGVGAAYLGGKKLWEHSSCGIKGSSIYRPWITAPGVDVVVPNIEQTRKKFHGTANAYIMGGSVLLPTDSDSQEASGTSFAAPYVTRMIMHAVSIFDKLEKIASNIRIFEDRNEIPGFVKLIAQLISHGYTISYTDSKLDFVKTGVEIYSDFMLQYQSNNEEKFLNYFNSLTPIEFIFSFFRKSIGSTHIKIDSSVFDSNYLTGIINHSKTYLEKNLEGGETVKDPFPLVCIQHIMGDVALVGNLPIFQDRNEIPGFVKLIAQLISRGHLLNFKLDVYKIKRILAEMAQKIPLCASHEQGNGYVDENAFRNYFLSIDFVQFVSLFVSDGKLIDYVPKNIDSIFDEKFLADSRPKTNLIDMNITPDI